MPGLMMPSVRLAGELRTAILPVTLKAAAALLPPVFEALTDTELPLSAVRSPPTNTPLLPPKLEPTMLNSALPEVPGDESMLLPTATTTPDCPPTPCTEMPPVVVSVAPVKSTPFRAPLDEPWMLIFPAFSVVPPPSETPANAPPDAPAIEMVLPAPPRPAVVATLNELLLTLIPKPASL